MLILASLDRSDAAGSLDKLATVASLSTVVILTSSTAELAPETFPPRDRLPLRYSLWHGLGGPSPWFGQGPAVGEGA
jgi:hypothetical protein